MSIFERASRAGLRFDSNKGLLSLGVEDLWNQSLPALDAIAVALHKKNKESEEGVSFLNKTSKKEDLNKLRFEVVKHILDTKVAEREEALAAAEKHDELQRLLELYQNKKDESLKALPLEELEKRIKEARAGRPLTTASV